ncbi:hypothetical protein MKW92_033559 [Papaver armeniacum]|nr:hypothetical protein MKW92_033559 [Papaver armeniacum]
MPGLTIGDEIPDLEVETTHGKFKLHDFIGNQWTILFSHPGDFTPVCTTELGQMAAYSGEFEKRGAKLLGLSCDDVQCHNEWIKDIEAYTMKKDPNGFPTPSRALHIVGTDKKVKLSFLYPATTGRNMDEIVRVLDSLQKAAKNKVATPVNWKQGDPVVISPSVTNDEAKKMFLRVLKPRIFHQRRNIFVSLMYEEEIGRTTFAFVILG